VAPGEPIQSSTVEFLLVARKAAFKNELGLFPVDDELGRIGDLRPTDRGYAGSVV
jgi:hypothetical protein